MIKNNRQKRIKARAIHPGVWITAIQYKFNNTSAVTKLSLGCLPVQIHLCWNLYCVVEGCWSILQDWEITAASEKLAECQETILNLGKQLKALASPKDASLFDNAIATQHNTITSTTTVLQKDMKVKNRSSLLDRMLAEDDTQAKVHKACDSSSCPTNIPDFIQPLEKILVLNGLKGQDDSSSVSSLAIVRAKKSGGRSLWKKLLGRRKKAKKKTHFPFNTWNAILMLFSTSCRVGNNYISCLGCIFSGESLMLFVCCVLDSCMHALKLTTENSCYGMHAPLLLCRTYLPEFWALINSFKWWFLVLQAYINLGSCAFFFPFFFGITGHLCIIYIDERYFGYQNHWAEPVDIQ